MLHLYSVNYTGLHHICLILFTIIICQLLINYLIISQLILHLYDIHLFIVYLFKVFIHFNILPLYIIYHHMVQNLS